jgi:hypothetical protein
MLPLSDSAGICIHRVARANCLVPAFSGAD